jgi:hypothetical protein
MFFHERAFRIEPLEHDVFAFVLRKGLSLAAGVGRGKVGRCAPDRWNIGRVKRAGCECDKCGEKEFSFHRLL